MWVLETAQDLTFLWDTGAEDRRPGVIRSCFTQHTHPGLQFRGYHYAKGASLFPGARVSVLLCSDAQCQALLWDSSQCGVMLSW